MLHDYEGFLEIPFRTALPHGDTYTEVEILAEYEYTAPFRGSRDEPPHGGEVEIVSVKFRRMNGTKWRNLPKRAFSYVALADQIFDEHESCDDGWADYRYEQMREEWMEARHG
jgi:hypothetical protein